MTGFLPPSPSNQPEAAFFWRKAADHELWLPRCEECSRFHFYPRGHCPHCHAKAIEWKAVCGLGTLYSFVIVERAPVAQFGQAVPYAPCLVDLDEGVRMASHIDVGGGTFDNLNIGARLKVAFTKTRNGMTIPSFKAA